MAQSHLYSQLQEKIRRDPGDSPTQMLDWYQERVKESRSRLSQGSADSYGSNLLLIKYAAQRHDVSTLQRLKPTAQAWSQAWKQDFNTTAGANPGDSQSLNEKIDGILFVLAAKRGNWHAMYKLATSRHLRKRWTPEMCLAMLRSRGALDMITSIQQKEQISQTELSEDQIDDTSTGTDVGAKQYLWNMFLREFRRYMPRAEPSSTPSAMPSWVASALLDLYSKSGKVESTLDLAWSYLQMHKRNPVSKSVAGRILHNAPSRLLTCPMSTIPGPRILNSILKAFRDQGNPKAVLQAFSILTHTNMDLPEESLISHPLLERKEFIFEPDNNTILLVMDVMSMTETHSKDLPMKLLDFLRRVDSAWGSWRVRKDPMWHPMFLDLRPMQRLLDLCLEVNAYRPVRQILRFQQGLLRRELKWHQSSRKKRIWRQGLNEFTILGEWTNTLAALRRRRWILVDQAQSLYSMALQLARLYRYRQPPSRPDQK